MGGLLKETAETKERQTKGRPKKILPQGRISLPKKLKELGISERQSIGFQKMAAIPEPEFERRIENMKRDPRGSTTAKMLKPVPKKDQQEPERMKRQDILESNEWLVVGCEDVHATRCGSSVS